MSDKKISALTAATTPLAGTEVLPIVQSGATVKVSVANLTAGRPVSATEVTITTGNLVIGTSGKGIDFSADPSAAGMTSELLDDYEEGNWTPVYQTTGTAFTSVTYAIQIGHYTKVGRQVTVSARMRTSALTVGAATGEVVIGGLPYAPSTSISTATGVVSGASNFAGDIPISGLTQASLLYLYYRTAANGADVPLAPADMGAGASANDIFITVTYFV